MSQPSSRKGQKVNTRNYRLVSLPGKMTKLVLLEDISGHMKLNR